MGLTNWRGNKIRKSDVGIAKSYLNEKELRTLNNLVEQYLIFAEGQALRKKPMYMKDWIKKLDGFLNLNDRDILNDAGKVTHELAKQNAENEYEKFRKSEQKRIDSAESDFDKLIRKLTKKKK